jgi:hypothetical protein
MLSGPLLAGAFDEALAVAAPSWIERAIALGWRAVGRGLFALHYLPPDRGGACGAIGAASMQPD